MKRGFTCGAFDLLHAGHILMLELCKSNCDYLTVGLHTNPSIDRPNKNRPIQSIYERWVQLNAVKYVDEIIPYDTEADLVNILGTRNIDIRFIGTDHINDVLTGDDICQTRNIKTCFTQRYHNYSSTELRHRISNASR